MSAPQQLPRELVPVEVAEAKRLLKEGLKTFASTILWARNQEQVIHSHLHLLAPDDKSFYAWKPKDFDLRKFIDSLKETGTNDCYFSVSLSAANLFFRCPFLGLDQHGLHFSFPERVFKVQRRGEIRLMIREGYVLHVEFKDPLFPENLMNKKVWDISASGMAFTVNMQEEVMFQPGLILKDIAFTVNGRKIVCDGEVRHNSQLPRTTAQPAVKVGIRFTNIRPGDSQHIASYVFEENRKDYSRFV